MNDTQQKLFREYAWDYFALHAEQRLKAFNFYIIFCAVVIGGFATIVSRNPLSTQYTFLPLLLIFFSFVFWKLDQRTSTLVKNGEQAIKYLDSLALAIEPEEAKVLALFTGDDNHTQALPKYPLIGGYFSYKRVFNWVFFVMGLVGLLGCIACFMA
jgi:hypothetical protein